MSLDAFEAAVLVRLGQGAATEAELVAIAPPDTNDPHVEVTIIVIRLLLAKKIHVRYELGAAE